MVAERSSRRIQQRETIVRRDISIHQSAILDSITQPSVVGSPILSEWTSRTSSTVGASTWLEVRVVKVGEGGEDATFSFFGEDVVGDVEAGDSFDVANYSHHCCG
jgi:hypothetical protein